MTLYFENRQGKMRKIARISDKLTVKEAKAEAIRHINAFCSERNFAIYYIRIWNTVRNGKPMTQFDVGSHIEFFFTDRIVYCPENELFESDVDNEMEENR